MHSIGIGESGSRVVVVGGGVVGLCVARELAARGVRVRVVEAEQVGAGASTASVGVLSAPKPGRSAFAQLCRDGYESYAQLAVDLLEETDVDIGYHEHGCVRFLERRPDDRKLEAEVARWLEVGVGAHLLERESIEGVLAGYGGRFDAGLELGREAVVDPGRLVEALRTSCLRRGVELLENAGSTELVQGESGGVEVCGDADHAKPGTESGPAVVVLAAGCWSGTAARRLVGQSLPVRPVRGQAVEIRHPAPRRIVHFTASFNGKGYYLVPRGDDRTWVGSTVEDVGYDVAITESGREELLSAAREVLPDLGEEDVVRHWAGLRPKAMRRGGPFLARWPGLPNLWVACGHYRSGILTAPPTARLLADAMVEGQPLPADFEF